MYLLIVLISAGILLPAHAMQGAAPSQGVVPSVVLTYDQQQREMASRKIAFNQKIYDHIAKALPCMPVELCGIMASFLELDLDWSKQEFYTTDIQKCSTFSCLVYLDSSHVAAGTKEGHIQIWKPQKTSREKAQLIKELDLEDGSIDLIDFCPKTGILAWGTAHGAVNLCNTRLDYSNVNKAKFVMDKRPGLTSLSLLGGNKFVVGGPDIGLYMGDLEKQSFVQLHKNSKRFGPCDTNRIYDVVRLNDKSFISTTGRDIKFHDDLNQIQFHDAFDGRIYDTLRYDELIRAKPLAIADKYFVVAFNNSIELFDIRNAERRVSKSLMQSSLYGMTHLIHCGNFFGIAYYPYNTLALWRMHTMLEKDQPLFSVKPRAELRLSHGAGCSGQVALASNPEGSALTAAIIYDAQNSGFMKTWNFNHIK